MSDDQAKAKGGRPRAEVPGVHLTTWVRTPDYDRLLALARKHETSISGVVRELLRLKLRQD